MLQMTKKAFIYLSSICSKQNLDAARISDYLIKNGYQIINNPRKADLILLCTCAVTNEKAKNSLDAVKKLKNYKGELIVSGCLPAMDKEDLDEIFKGKKIITKDIEQLDQFFKDHKIKITEIKDANKPLINVEGGLVWTIKKIFKHSGPLAKIYLKIRNYIYVRFFEKKFIYNEASQEIKNSYHIRISRGCLGNCSYCAIKKAIGSLKSKPLEQILDEFKEGLKLGFKNFLIVADDIGAYGIDIGTNFPTLLNELTSIEGNYQIELEESHPDWIVKYKDEFGKILEKGKINKICIPIQSGSERILKLMNRYSDIDKIKQSIITAKKANPTLLVGTNLIIGFPTETEGDFEKTIEVLRLMRFDYGTIFSFSIKKNTRAEEIEPKISEEEIKKRMKIVEEFLKQNGYQFFNYKAAIMFFSTY